MAENAILTQLIIFFLKKSVENDPDRTPSSLKCGHPKKVENDLV